MKNKKLVDKSSYFLLFSFLGISRQRGATILDNLEIANIDIVMNFSESGELIALLAETKLSINNYLEELINSTVKSLADIIAFNLNNPDLVSS